VAHLDKKPGPVRRGLEIFDLPAEVVAGVPKLTVTGCRRVLVENHKGITEYGRELIEISGGRVKVRVHGEGLELVAMNHTELLIAGQIFTVEFE
jgi:sporulation protein YqfC